MFHTPTQSIIIGLLTLSFASVAATAKPLDKRSKKQIKKCNAGDALSCRFIAERYQAGLVGDNRDMAKLLREAAKYYRKITAEGFDDPAEG